MSIQPAGSSKHYALLAAAACCLAFFAGCKSLPNVDEEIEQSSGGAVQLQGARRPLSAERTAEILKKLQDQSGAANILQRHMAVEEAVVERPLFAGNKVTLLEDGDATYRSMFAAIRAAKDHVNLEVYTIEDDEVGRKFSQLLLEKQAQGVQVNLIYDGVGSLRTPRAFFENLKQAGVNVLEFNPVNPLNPIKGWQVNHRDHRKLLVVDGRIAYVGGINIGSVYSGGSFAQRASGKAAEGVKWRDTHIQIEGPVVAEFQRAFLETWEKQKGPPLAAKNYNPQLKAEGDDVVHMIATAAEERRSLIYITLVSAINSAETSVHLTTAYFVPDPQLLKALTDAVQRGVDVKLILPSKSDSPMVLEAGRASYTDLLRAGVKIYERRDRILHSKTALIDDVWACIGSTNLDWRSFLHNDEINAVILGEKFARQARAVFDKDIAQSDAIDLAQWRRRPLGQRLREGMAQMWQYWF